MAGLENRRKSEWTLFQTGYYDKIDKYYVGGNSKIIEIADKIHKYMEDNNYSYCVLDSTRQGDECRKFGHICYLPKTFEASKLLSSQHHSCCANYVSWVLQEAGYLEASDHVNGASAMRDKLTSKGWTKIYDRSELKPGDVLWYRPSPGSASSGHVDIYAGDNKVYDAGSGDVIRGASPRTRKVWDNFEYGFRVDV